MGTRGLCGFRVDNKDYLAYNHFDSYPEGLGRDVVNFLKDKNLDVLKEQVRSLVLVNEDDRPTLGQIEKCREIKTIDLGVSSGVTSDWYCLLRKAQGDLQAYLDLGFMPDNKEFLENGLFCEWAYQIDLDKETLSVFKAGNLIADLDLTILNENQLLGLEEL